MLGLRYGAVELVDHDPRWAEAFGAERERLVAALAGVACAIEHIGSTSVPGLVAKPILDIGVGLDDGEAPESTIEPLRGIGYIHRGDAGSEGGHIFVRESSPLVRTHHVHVVARRDPQWERYLAFRDHLRRSAASRAAYAREKLLLAGLYAGDRKSYTKSKDAICQRIISAACGGERGPESSW